MHYIFIDLPPLFKKVLENCYLSVPFIPQVQAWYNFQPEIKVDDQSIFSNRKQKKYTYCKINIQILKYLKW
jgi:hypothetical protein